MDLTELGLTIVVVDVVDGMVCFGVFGNLLTRSYGKLRKAMDVNGGEQMGETLETSLRRR